VQDRAARRELQALEIELHAAAAQPQAAGGVGESARGDALGSAAEGVTHVVDCDVAAEVAEHHREASRTAIRG
jgi:hypothetical protein